MTSSLAWILLATTAWGASGQNSDIFNYGHNDRNENGVTSRGQSNWDQVRCGDAEICTGYPNKFPAVQQNFSFYQWDIDDKGNFCQWCPEDSPDRNCGVHRQSPIDMRRYVGIDTHELHKECKDWHWMQYKDDTCTWERMRTELEINRHALQIWIPVREDGKIDCWEQGMGRRYARLDYSKGFPDWWWLQRTDISVPSQHTQEGFRYAAEVTLAHFYQIAHDKNEMGYVTMFMQDYPDEPSWPFLDKLICAWREKEEQVRATCGEDPAPPYGRCRIFTERGQQPTLEWLEEAGMAPTSSPTAAPSTASPTSSPTGNPTASPTSSPSALPTKSPTRSPTSSPTPAPTPAPGRSPAREPSEDDFEQNGGNRPSRFRPPEPEVNPDSVPSPPTPMPSKSPTSSPTVSPTEDPTTAPTTSPTLPPTKRPTTRPSPSPTGLPTSAPTDEVLPPEIDCDNFYVPGGYSRMCSSTDPCCEEARGDSNFCWNVYDNIFPGPVIESACYHCCPGKEIGPDKDPHPDGIEKTIQCSDYNVQRYCRANSCCDMGMQSSDYCSNEFTRFGAESWEQICWYCCSTSHNVVTGLEGTRRTLVEEFGNLIQSAESSYLRSKKTLPFGGDPTIDLESRRRRAIENDEEDDEDESVVIFAEGRMFRLQKEDFAPAEEDPEEYIYGLYNDYKDRRRMTQDNSFIHEEDYEDVDYWPYEWMLHVGTEYYYRYEGTQTVPPCREFVHWRVMKDPLRVHPRQIEELNRLLAWRLNPNTCQQETAGTLSNDGNSVDVSRDIQYRHRGHRDTFCECKDWPSKFDNDKDWCRDWEEDVNFDRFYMTPYSFDTNGEWLPGNSDPPFGVPP